MNWINRLFSDVNGVPDDARVAAFLLVLAYIALEFAGVFYQKVPFSPWEFGTGATALAGGIGGWFALRKDN